MKRKNVIIILVLLAALASSAVWINRDLFRFDYDTLLERTFVPETDSRRDYLILGPIGLKPGSYTLSPTLQVTGTGSSLFMLDGDEQEFFSIPLDDGMENPFFPFEIHGASKQVRVGIRYQPETSAISIERIHISAEHVLYRENLLRHLTLTALLFLFFLWLGLRICFPRILWKVFPAFSNPQNEFALLVLLALTAASGYPLLNPDTYVHGEDMFFHLTRIKGSAESLRAGYFPVRDQLYWLNNYGYGAGFFYPDVFLYFPAVLVLLGFGVLSAYKIFLLVCSFASILSTWYAALRITGNRTAAYGAAVFIAFASYRLSNLYYRGAVGETQAAIFYPLIILGLYEIFYRDTGRWPVFALGFLGLLYSHMISLAMAGLITLCFVLIQFRKVLKNKAIRSALVKSVLLVLGLGAFFWIPMLEQSFTNPELRINNVLTGTEKLNVTNYAFPVKNLLARFKTWNYAWQADCIYPGWSLLAVPMLAIAVRRKREGMIQAADWMLGFSIPLLWMCTRAFPWTWSVLLPFVTRIQFAYRLLLPASVLLSLAGGIYFAALVNQKHTWAALPILALFCFLITAFPVLEETSAHRTVDKRLFVMQDNRVSGAEYLPRNLDSGFPGRNADTVLLEGSDIPFEIQSHNRQKLTFRFSYELPEDSAPVNFSVPLIYYTGFRADLTGEDGKTLHPEVRWDSRGLVSVSNEGINKGSIFVYYAKTGLQWTGEYLTLIALMLFIACERKKQSVIAGKNVTQRV